VIKLSIVWDAFSILQDAPSGSLKGAFVVLITVI